MYFMLQCLVNVYRIVVVLLVFRVVWITLFSVIVILLAVVAVEVSFDELWDICRTFTWRTKRYSRDYAF